MSDTLEIVKARLADGRAIADGDVHDLCAEIERLRGEIERLRAALKDMLHAVCGETGFAAAVRAHSKTAYPWEPLDIAEEKARAALRENSHD